MVEVNSTAVAGFAVFGVLMYSGLAEEAKLGICFDGEDYRVFSGVAGVLDTRVTWVD
jgi:hypothetical protein